MLRETPIYRSGVSGVISFTCIRRHSQLLRRIYTDNSSSGDGWRTGSLVESRKCTGKRYRVDDLHSACSA
jgi:hypothetical protein